MFKNAITLFFFFFYKSASFFFFFLKTKIRNVDKWKSTKQVQSQDFGSQIWQSCWKWRGQSFVFEGADSLKKLSEFYFYLLLECFEKKKKKNQYGSFMASLNKLNKYLYNMNPMMGNQLCNLFLNTTLCCNWLINLMLGDQLCKLLNVLLIQFFFNL